MLKKIITISALIASLTTAYAGGSKDIINKGFYVNVGLGFMSQKFNTDATLTTTDLSGAVTTGQATNETPANVSFSPSFGVMPNIEIGNQWYFWKQNSLGIGIRASWLQFGYSSFTIKSIESSFGGNSYTGSTDFSGGLVDLRLIKLAPQFTYALTEDMALDFSFEVSPTLLIAGASYKDANSSENNVYGNINAGLLFAPGIKFRYKIFAAGFDYSFGSLGNIGGLTVFDSNQKSVFTFSGSVPTSMPRIYLGFKF